MPPSRTDGQPGFWLRLARLTVLLAALQAFRAGLTLVQYNLLDQWGWDCIHIAAFLITGGLFLVALRPAAVTLGLDWRDLARHERTLYLDLGGLLVALVIWSGFRWQNALAHNLAFAVVIPLCEEVLFRGYLWSRIRAIWPGPYADLAALLVTTAFFGLWHLGYIDVLMPRVLPGESHALAAHIQAVSLKLWSALLLGLVAAAIRWRSGHVFGPILVHGFWNFLTANL